MSTAPSEVPSLWTAEMVAEQWLCSPRYVYDLASRGILPCVRFGKRLIRFRPEDVQLFQATRLGR